jgi:hypothetical protein
VKAKIIYIAILFGAIVFNILLIISLHLYIDVDDHLDRLSWQFAEDSISGEKAVFFAAVIPYFVCLFSISEGPLLPFRVSAVSAGTRGPPVLYSSFDATI